MRPGPARGCTVTNEEQDLLHPDRLANGYREYPPTSVVKVEQIRDLLSAGLSTETIRELFPCFVGVGADFLPMVHPDVAANLARELEQIELRIDVLVRNGKAIRRYLKAATATTPEAAAPPVSAGTVDG